MVVHLIRSIPREVIQSLCLCLFCLAFVAFGCWHREPKFLLQDGFKIFSCNDHWFLLWFFGLFRFVVKLQRKMRKMRSWVLKNQKTNKGTSMYICTSLWLWSFQNEQKIVIFTHIWVEKLKSIQKYLGLILFVCLQGRRRWCKWDWVYYKTG